MTQNTPHFPLFVDLTGKRCVVVGGGPVAARRADVLARFGAAVTVVSPVWSGSAGNIQWLRRPYAPGDLDGAYLAIAATDRRDVNHRVGCDARALGIRQSARAAERWPASFHRRGPIISGPQRRPRQSGRHWRDWIEAFEGWQPGKQACRHSGKTGHGRCPGMGP